ncbi:MAG: serine/threonine protein kinase [Planctomycetes bacterium]|nr:serine/threonine protein kinase [Planctomycetota bacterium]
MTIDADRPGADTHPPAYGAPGARSEDDGREPRRRDVDRLFQAEDFPLPAELRSVVHDAAERLFGAPAEAPYRPGDRLGPFRIVRLLGAGGQAWVYEATQEQLQRRVALKVPRPDVAERVVREARLTAPLEHPHIVRVEQVADDGEAPFLVMECCQGGSLDHLLERYPGGLPVADVRAVARGVLEALAFAHGRGVVHRDVKPGNVLFDARGTPKLADLGIGTISAGAPDLVQSGTLSRATLDGPMGTPLFVAPEQEDPSRLRGAAIDGRADLFSFGKTLFVMLTGASPRTIRPPSRLRPDLHPAWDDLVFRLVEEDRERRFRDAGEVLAALARVPDLEPPAAPPAPAPRPAHHAGRIFLLGALASAAFAAFLEAQHTTVRLGPEAWLELAPLKVGALLGAAFLLWFRRLERRARTTTSTAAALALSALLAGWAPALYGLAGALPAHAFELTAQVAAGCAAVLGAGCAVTLFPPRRRHAPAVRVRARPRGPVGRALAVVGQVVGAVAGLLTAAGAMVLAALGFVLVFLTATVKGCAEALGVQVHGAGGGVDPGAAAVVLAIVASVGATLAVFMVVGLLRRIFAGPSED